MLGKLLVYELKGTYKKIGVILFLTVGAYISLMLTIDSLINSSYDHTIAKASAWLLLKIVIEVIGIYAGFIYAIITIFKRFYSSIFGKYAYFNMSLPVKPYETVLSKLIVVIGTYALIALGYISSTYFIFRDSPLLIDVSRSQSESYTLLMKFIEQFISPSYFIYASVAALYSILLIYFCITLGATMKNRGAGIAIGVVSFLVISNIISYLDVYILVPDYFKLIFSPESYYAPISATDFVDIKLRFMASAVMYFTLSIMGFYFITYRIKSKLSLR